MATGTELRQKVVSWAEQFEGIQEHSDAHRAILEIFNSSGLCPRYWMTEWDAWCGAFASAAFIANGLAGVLGSDSLLECVECYCDSVIALAQQQGIWIEEDGIVPNPGDLVLYDWDDSGAGDNTGSTEHIGIVAECDGQTITVIEGNMGGSVGYRTLPVNGQFIRGFVCPDFNDWAAAHSYETTDPEIDNSGFKSEGKAVIVDGVDESDPVYVRSSPNGPVIGFLVSGQEVEVDNWVHVYRKGIGEGYIYGSWLDKEN